MGCGTRGSTGYRAFLAATTWCLVLFCGVRANSQCVAVTPTGSGSGNGSNWSNAMAGTPASLTPGTTYYLADGSYPSQKVSSGGSASSVINIKKATAADFGQNCSPSIGSGWNASTMGSSQANLAAPFTIQGNYFTLDGASSNSDGTGGGIKITITASNTSCPGFGKAAGIYVTDFSSGVMDHVTIQHVEIALNASIYTLNPDLCAVSGVYATGGTQSGPKVSNFTLQNNYIHDVTGPIELWANTATIQNNIIARNNGNAAGTQHSEAWADTGSSNVIARFNKFIDIVSTGVIVTVNSSLVSNANNWAIYGNLFYWSIGNPNLAPSGVDNGVISCGAGKVCSSWVIYNNTISGCNWVVSGYSSACGIDAGGAGSGSSITSENNLWYNSTNVTFSTGSGATQTHDYNTCVVCTGFSVGAHDATGSINPFINNTNGVDNFALTQDMSSATTAGTQWAQGVALAAPYNVDITGATRGSDGTWDRGAYESSSGTSSIQPPSNLQVSVF